MNRMMSGWPTSGRKHDPLDRDGQHEHHQQRAPRTRARPATPICVQPHQRQRREHHHDALRKVEDPARPEDQHEAQRDQRIEDARHQTLPQHLQQEVRGGDHVREGLDRTDRRNSISTCLHGALTNHYPHGMRMKYTWFAASAFSVMRHPQIGVDHVLIVAHLVGRAVPDLLAVIHHHDPVARCP